MSTSTPRRSYYNLRSSNRVALVGPTSRLQYNNENLPNVPVTLRKRNSAPEETRCHKRQRTQQSHGPPFLSPDSMNLQRPVHIEGQRPIVNLPARMSLALEGPYGNFGKLPKDVVFHILSRIPYILLGRMAMTSTSWNRSVCSYVKSGSFRLRWLADIEFAQDAFNNIKPSSEDPFYAMGVLAKFITANDEWSTRLSCLKSFLTLAYEEGASISGLGQMIYSFVLRPDEEVVLEQIDDIVSMVFSVVGSLKDELSAVMTRPDEDRRLEDEGRDNLHILYYEIELRRRVLALFLNNGSSDPGHGLNKYFLSSLMKEFKNIHNTLPTTLFYLLFAPTTIHQDEEVIHWHRLSLISVMTVEDAHELKPLARALYGLLQCRQLKQAAPWTKNCLFNVMEEITTYPTPWSMNTFVSLHVLEPELVPIGVVARMNRSHEDEAGDMICTMKMLLHRWKMDVHGVMERVVDPIIASLRQNQRRTLFHRVWDWHERNIDDLRERLGPSASEICAEIESQMEVLPVLMKLCN